ncbi:AAA family ATPase [Providencia alcalifaciens]|uniref:AAA family ATPase n=1 Tax=Providencia alcalifaciens TaxID=126385 RepID=UPI00044F0F88|nr:AAA family ATPase [Providencia alcalifaciens]ETT05486.1 ABC transporter, ATP-binding protein [Providencia alcalifaciens F90-2004]EUC94649.1 ABC transporter, ATP-binding protein [Providencia alcalifaciens PAL-2]MTB33687.1 AAA family ATPase [Providencia alcalifaciens]MTD00164.1 AAA family ATPase [Providencia alcalifaciens]
MKIKVVKKYKSIPENIEFDLPDFSILTGRNGSGKSHLLEVIANQEFSQVISGEKTLTNILHVGYNALNPQVDDRCESYQLVQSVNEWWSQINGIIAHYKMHHLGIHVFNDIINDFVINTFGMNTTRDSILRTVLNKTGKQLEEITEQDLFENITFSVSDNSSLFFSQCAKIFKAYHLRWTKNKFNKFLNQDQGKDVFPVLSDNEFFRRYGPAPWDLINEILSKAQLPYKFPHPGLSDSDLAYVLKLVDESTGTDISVNDLSSGEKVLMSLALAIYNTQEGGVRPDMLLLDEPDAPLHPQYSKLLLETVIETIVKFAGVKVIMTTHSPATVAIAPDNCVYEINRDSKVPVMISSSKAVETLTQGIDFLRISYEKRRQIFVESKYDVIYFEKLFNTLNRKYKYSYQPIFMEPHSGTSNCTDVISIVDKLRNAGNDLVWGIIDFDNTNSAKDTILVLGDGKRYAIENYLLDPLYIILALIRCRKSTYEDFGVNTQVTYSDAALLSQSECQILIDNFMLTIELPLDDFESVTLENGYHLNYPRAFLRHQGHSYETLIQRKFAGLNAISKGQGDSALKLGLAEVIEEFPQFLPIEIGKLFALMNK